LGRATGKFEQMAALDDPLSQWFAIPAFFVLFRETLEATVLVAVIVQYLQRANQPDLIQTVYWGAAFGGLASALFACAILGLYYATSDIMNPEAQSLFEACMLAFASICITFFVITHLAPGMKSKKQWKEKWEKQMGNMIENALKGKDPWNFFMLTFTSVFREGIEAVIFILGIAAISTPAALVFGSLGGLLAGCLLGFCMFLGLARVDLSAFFIASAVFLLFIAAGLAAHASYEFQKAGIFGTWACSSCEDDGSYCEDVADHTAYRRLLWKENEMRRLTTARAKSCDGAQGTKIAWVNQELWDITGCCDVDNMFFFLLMVLFWYRPAPTNLEVLVYISYWTITLIWGWSVVFSIRGVNQKWEKDHCGEGDVLMIVLPRIDSGQREESSLGQVEEEGGAHFNGRAA